MRIFLINLKINKKNHPFYFFLEQKLIYKRERKSLLYTTTHARRSKPIASIKPHRILGPHIHTYHLLAQKGISPPGSLKAKFTPIAATVSLSLSHKKEPLSPRKTAKRSRRRPRVRALNKRRECVYLYTKAKKARRATIAE